MVWTNIPDADVDVNSPNDEDLMGGLRDNLRAMRTTVFGYSFTEFSSSSASPVDAATIVYLYIPDVTLYTGQTKLITVPVDCKVASGNGDVRVYDTASATGGSYVNITATSYGTILSPTLTVDASWLDTYRTIKVQIRNNSGVNTFVQAENYHAGTLDY